MIYTHVTCLKNYYSPLDRTKVLHIDGVIYKAHKSVAEGFYAVEVECYEGQPVLRVGVQLRDTDYEFK